jgi:hypothetical protein
LAAYRQAALVDLSFALPLGSNATAAALARQAQKEARETGAVAIRADVPTETKPGAPVKVAATLDEKIVPRVSRIGVVASADLSTGSKDQYTRAEPADKTVRFEIPGSLFVKDAVAVRFDALDARGNRLASLERKVEVQVPRNLLSTTDTTGKQEKEQVEKSSGFWSTPWPYIIGGVALAAGGAALYFVTRPSDSVTVGAASVRVR